MRKIKMDYKFYNTVLSRIKKVVYKIDPSNFINPEEFISEAFLEGLPMNENIYVEWIIKKVGLKENRYSNREIKEYSDRRCRKCGEIKPSGAFRSWYLRGYLIFDSYCAVCKNRIISISKKKQNKKSK